MAKPIKITKDLIDKMVEEFKASLKTIKLSDGKVSYVRALTYKDPEEGVKIFFTPEAYAKMLLLLHSFSDEVGWNGTVERTGPKEFVITDVVVYPQIVTGTTVDTDQEAYQKWIMELPDEVFGSMRMQGHSHVNMSTSPSSTDIKFYEDILAQLRDDDYYIFMIYNKRLEHTVMVYDMKSNILYENKDIEVGIASDSGDLESFLSESKKLVEKRYSYSPAGSNAIVPAGTGSTAPYSGGYTDTTTSGKGKKGGKAKQSKFGQCPGAYGGYGYDYGGVGHVAPVIDYDREVFGPKVDWNDD